jgi:Zn-dependent protease with chaperone function
VIAPSDAELADILWPVEPPPRTIRCRHCDKGNRVPLKQAVFDPDRCKCGACGGALFLGRDEPLLDIDPKAYEHPLDRKALAALEALPGFPLLVRWLLREWGERRFTQLFMAGHLLVGDEQFPELFDMLDQARSRLDIDFRPTLFLAQSPFVNAATSGVEERVMVVYSGMLHQFSDDELVAVLGHELGHLHSDHVLYHVLAQLLLGGGMVFGGLGKLVTTPLRLALAKWHRCSELTADRAGLLACRDVATSLWVELKLAGGSGPGVSSRTELKLGPFVQQARDLAEIEESSWMDAAVALLLSMNRSHPFAAWRLLHLLRWVENGSYLDILAGHYRRVDAE